MTCLHESHGIQVMYRQRNRSVSPIYLRYHLYYSPFTALIFHGGGFMAGSDAIIPNAQIKYLTERNFIVVIPNYRLAPQVSAKEAFDDCEEAYSWATTLLPNILKAEHGVQIDGSRTIVMGHSAGGTLAMHLGSVKPVKAVTAFYPSLFVSDASSSIHQPTSAMPFAIMPDFEPTEEDWAVIKPSGYQVSEVPFPVPGTPLPVRSKVS
jgi:pimeloyl-ACP methyl ester carboxylesterase